MSDIRADFAERLRAAGITAVPAGGDALRLSLGRRSERVVEVGPALSAAAALDARHERAAYLRGMVHAACSLAGPTGAPSFIEAASSLTPLLDHARFSDGVASILGARPLAWPHASGLQMLFQYEVRDACVAVTEETAAAWGATAERVERAAASILLHRFRGATRVACEQDARVTGFVSSDASAAPRWVLLEYLDFDAYGAGLWIAAPSVDELWTARRSEMTGDEFRGIVEHRYASAAEPLSTYVGRS
jgi:hypothetical protein